MDTTLQSPSIESFSYSWLANLNATPFDDPDLYLASNEEASYYHDEAPFIEMDPRLPPSKRFIRVSSDFGFDFPVSESPLSLVHADEVICNGILVPILVKDSKRDRLIGTEDCHVPTTTSVPLSAQKPFHCSSRVVCVSLRRCRRLSNRWFHKYLKKLFRPFFCKRGGIGEFGNMDKKWGFSAATSPRSSSVTYSADDDWRRSCDSESSIYEAVLHCKRTRGLVISKRINQPVIGS